MTSGCTRNFWMGRSAAEKNKLSPSGSRNPVFRVTGGDTVHYTNEELRMQGFATSQRHCPDITIQSMAFSYAGPALTSLNKAWPFLTLAQPLHHKIPDGRTHHELKSLSIWNATCYRGHYLDSFFLHLLRWGHEKR